MAYLLCLENTHAIAQAPMPLDEITCDKVLSSGNSGGKTFFVGSRWQRGSIPEISLFLYDFETKTVRDLTDPRIQISILCQVHPRDGDFLLWDHYTGSIFHLSHEGTLSKTQKLAHFEGAEARFRSKYIFPLDGSVGLATLADLRGTGRYRLAVVDPDDQSLITLHEITIPDSDRCFWVPHKRNLLFVHPERGEITVVETTSLAPIRTIRSREDAFSRKGRLIPLLTTPILAHGTLSMKLNRLEDEHGRQLGRPEKMVLNLNLDTEQLQTDDREILLGRNEAWMLLYHIEEQTFRTATR